MEELETARRAALRGGEVAMQFLNGEFQVRSKNAADLVTDADVAAEEAIVEIIQQECPGHAILGEEAHAADVDADHLWLVDPIDGTTNFAHRIPHFGVSVAYYARGVAQCGVVLNPARNDLYEAWRGGGAWHNGRRLHVNAESALDQSLIGTGFYYDRGKMMENTLAAVRDLFRQQIHGVRRFGTSSLDLAHVAAGYYGAYFEYLLSPWDFAAGRLLVEEAGGRVTNCAGDPLPLEKTHVLASNGRLHEPMLRIVRERLMSAAD